MQCRVLRPVPPVKPLGPRSCRSEIVNLQFLIEEQGSVFPRGRNGEGLTTSEIQFVFTILDFDRAQRFLARYVPKPNLVFVEVRAFERPELVRTGKKYAVPETKFHFELSDLLSLTERPDLNVFVVPTCEVTARRAEHERCTEVNVFERLTDRLRVAENRRLDNPYLYRVPILRSQSCSPAAEKSLRRMYPAVLQACPV